MAVVYFAGAETGDLSELASTSGTVTAQTTFVHTGNYAYLVNGSTGSSGATFTVGLNATTSFFRCWLIISAPPSPGAVALIQIRDSTETLIGKVILNPSSTLQAQAMGGTAGNGTHALAYGIWYLVEANYIVGSGGGSILQVRLGGAVEATSTNGTSITNVDNWTVAAGENMNAGVDDVCIRNDQYAGDGRCLARQGMAGTPSHTAWTETGGAIYVVWSNTPYSDAQYSSATAQSQEQTMLTASFSPGGIGPIDTINSVKVGAVGRLSAAGATAHQLIFRFNGTDNFGGNQTGLTTADSYGEYYPATLPTLAQINSSEAGGAQGANSTALWTIEDLWVMVDFTPVWFDEMPTNAPMFDRSGVVAYGG